MAARIETVPTPIPETLRALGDEPHEFLNGHLLRKEAVGRLQHSHLGRVIERLLKPLATAQKSHIAAEWTVLHGKEWATPDVTLAYPGSPIVEGYALAPVQLVVESVSLGQRHKKLFSKCIDIYHAWGIPYCWVIDPDEQCAYEIHSEQAGLVRPAQTLTAGPNIELAVATTFAELNRELQPF